VGLVARSLDGGLRPVAAVRGLDFCSSLQQKARRQVTIRPRASAIARRRAEEERVNNASPFTRDDEVGGVERDARADT
jgi:hypothetical protein